MTSYSPVVKAESFACTKNSTSGTLYLDCGSEQSVRNDTAAISSQRTISQRQNWSNTTPFNFEVLRGANNHPPFLPARLSGSGRTQNESLCVDNGCENADFAR